MRRSTRLASKQDGGAGAELQFEQGEGHEFNLKRTPYQRVTQKRKRTVPLSDHEGAQEMHSSKVFTQDQFQENVKDVPDGGELGNGVEGEMYDDSFENGSFLRAVDELEAKIDSEQKENKDASQQFASSQDMFGDDADFLEAIQKEPEPQPSTSTHQKDAGKLTSKYENDFRSAREVFETSSSESAKQVIQPKSNKKTDKKKKKKSGGGQNGKKKPRKFKVAYTNRKPIKEIANSAGNELSLEDLSYMSQEEKLHLSSWGLPPQVLQNYKKKNIEKLFPWQLECLENEKVLEGKNLLYSAPTSAGKTLVSEILMLKRVLQLGRKAIMILPFVSVAREKVYSLQSIFGDAGVRVEGFMGSVNPPGGFKAVDIAICTIEKANSLINRLLEEGSLSDLGTLVVDELHLIGDPNRGYLLELLLTKILYMTSLKNDNGDNSMNATNEASELSSLKPKRFNIQIVGMSATLPNLDVLAKWLNAELFVTDFRPVPLKERLKLDGQLLDESLVPVRDVITDEVEIEIEDDTDSIVYLALETVLQGYSILIFCPSRKSVETTALKIAGNFYRIGDSKIQPLRYPEIFERLRARLSATRIKTVLEQLEGCPGGVDKSLHDTVMMGVGFHHAGLTYENRDIIESAFKQGILKVIVATSTLSAGVNLPARRVVIATPNFNGTLLDTLTYRQMCGRAGRNGIDKEGESILICPANLKDQENAKILFRGSMYPVRSALLGDGSLTSSMKRAMLEAIASGISTLVTDVRSYAKCTFLFHSLESGLYETRELSLSQLHKDDTIEECVEYLKSQDFIQVKRYEQEDKPDEYMPTQLGSACLASSLSPDDGIIVYRELLKARECFVLENELHVIYQVTPIYVSDNLRNLPWSEFLNIYEKLNLSQKKVGELVGIQEAFIIKAMLGSVSWSNPAQRPTMAIHQRFYAALALSDLVNEISLDKVSKKYDLPKGTLQNLQQTASTFAGMVTAFCGRLGWSNLELLLSQFQERLEFGVQRELVDLVRLDCLNGQRARVLYNGGMKNIMELAGADAAQIQEIIHKATPFESDVHGEKKSTIWMIGREVLSETQIAQKIVDEARTFIKIELGQQGNVKFSFGDEKEVSKNRQSQKHRSNTSNFEENAESKVVEMNKSVKDSNELQVEFENASHNMKELNETHSNANAIENNANKSNEIQNEMDMDDVFTQYQGELEQSQRVYDSKVDGKNIEEEMFEDSFPEIVSTNISALYANPVVENPIDEPQQTNSKFSIAMHVESQDFLHARVSDAHNNMKDENILSSTPVFTNGKKSRFTRKTDDYASPVRAPESPVVESTKKEKETGRGDDEEEMCEIQKNMSIDPLEEKLERTSAVFEDSLAEVFESSFDFSKFEKGHLEAHNKNGNGNISVKLSESDTEACRAIAEDSNFESEELFPIVEENDGKEEPMDMEIEQKSYVGTPDTHPTNIKTEIKTNGEENLDGLGISDWDDEDFIMTQVPSTPSEQDNAMEVEEELFQESSSDTEYESSEISASTCSPAEQNLIVQEVSIGGLKLVTKITQNVDLIPAEFFSGSEIFGVGLKLETQVKSSTSIAYHGIGAKVLGRRPSCTNLNTGAFQRQHSIALYNGKSCIWVLRWDVDSHLKVAGRSESGTKRLEALLTKLNKHKSMITLFDCKEKLRSLLKQCGTNLLTSLPREGNILDPKVAQWMWDYCYDDSEHKTITKKDLIDKYASQHKQITSLSLPLEATEAYLVWKVMEKLQMHLKNKHLWDHYLNAEMPCIIPLLIMEMNGFGLNVTDLSNLKSVLQFNRNVLELRAYEIVGRQFSLNSSKEIQQILYKDIGLTRPKGKGTGKDILSKIDHELARIIIEWRKINNTLTKYVIPFQQERSLETSRVHGSYSHFTCTGRVPMSDPSLQSIPKDFDIPTHSYTRESIEKIKNSSKLKFGSKINAILQQLEIDFEIAAISNNTSNVISMRNVFTSCSSEFTILTADYSQLELRILAHLSGDEKLIRALNNDTDVFVEIASQWRNIPKDKVTYSIRQDAKAIVYGIIYGMGANTLADKMDIEPSEADNFMRLFMKAYPGVQSFKTKCQQECQQKGYVETMTGRRRYLPLIHSRNIPESEKAKRQAINSRIQGSAADLVKCAMARIHSFLMSTYPKSAPPVDWSKLSNARRKSMISNNVSTVASPLDNFVFFPILNLHDELIFEVRKTHLSEIAKRIKHEMETSLKLSVKLPVVIKAGDTWGSLETYDIF